MIKKISFCIFIFSLLFFTSNAQDGYFYYYKGEKIRLPISKNCIYVIAEKEFIESSNSKLFFSNFYLESDDNNQIPNMVKFKFTQIPTEDEYFNIMTSLRQNNRIKYVLPFFENENLPPIGTSDLFYLELKTQKDSIILQHITQQQNVQIVKQIPNMPLWYILSIQSSTFYNALEASNYFYETGHFEDVDPAFMLNYIPQCTNDSLFNQLWGLKNEDNQGIDINVCDAWNISRGNGVNVAVIDRSIDFSHHDLAANIHSLSLDSHNYPAVSIFTCNDPPDCGHGTHVAGTIAAVKNNHLQVVGVAPESKIMGISSTFGDTNTISAELASAFSWAWQVGADVINNSWGVKVNSVHYPYYHSTILENAIFAAMTQGRGNKGCIIVFASGNNMDTILTYPGNFHEDILTVGAINQLGNRRQFSNYGSKLDVVAPGEYILSTLPNNMTGYDSGTSMAAPHVSGIAALVLSVNPNLTRQQVLSIIESTTYKINEEWVNYEIVNGRPNGIWNYEYGYGLVNAYDTVCAARCYLNLPVVTGTISQNTTWNNPVHAVGSIIIPNGITLIVKSQVKCDMDASITIKPGGKLIIDGGTLTNACEGEMWKGITIMDNTPQQPKGMVTVTNNGKIENAVCGITVNGGGYVTASNAQFINNMMGVYFKPLVAGQTGSQSIFTKTHFTLTNSYIGNLTNFEAHIKMESSASIEVRGCQFSSIAPQNNIDKNNGIWALNSPLTVTEYCPPLYQTNDPDCKCLLLGEPSELTGFTHGIFARNTGTSPTFIVRHSNFKDNKHGVKIDAIHYHKVIRNNFIFENSSNAFGLYVFNATGYKIEENIFENRYPAVNNTGLTIKNSGSSENEVYKNTFDGLYIGQNFLRRNSAQLEAWRGIPPLVSFNAGLQTLCNTFNKTHSSSATPRVHILIGTDATPPDSDNDHIRKNQGSSTLSAGNTFLVNPTYLKIKNNKHTIDYHYANSNENPTLCSSNVVTILAPENSCPSKIGSIIITPQDKSGIGNLEKILAQYDEWNEQYEYWLAKLLATEVGSEEYNFLLDKVSYYSALKDNYFNGIIVTAMSDEGETEKENFYKNLRYLFNYRNHYTDNLSIVETHLAEVNFEKAFTTLNKIYEQFELTEEQNDELNGLQTYIHWLQQLKEKGKNIYALSEEEVMQLVNYVETNTGCGKVFANNILCALYDICLEEGETEKGRKGEKDDEMIRGLDDEMIENQSKSAQSVSSEFQNSITLCRIPPPEN